jgi:TPR repeat protein/NTP pyrophosphatase (non-canonical NTP hydrolase)
MEERRYEFPPTAEGLALLVKELRKPYGCPWDRKQTLESLRSSLCGECAEVVEAIDLGDRANLCEELGDLLMNVTFLAVIAEEEGAFDWSKVCQDVIEKMVRRHEHVFGTSKPTESAEEVIDRWQKIKSAEKLRALGSFKPDNPNYVACFVPYSDEEKNLKKIPDFSKADRIRYTMLKGYTESKQFYSPDYKGTKPQENKDFRRTLLWEPSVAVLDDGGVALSFYNGSATQYIDVDIQGRGKNIIYGNAAEIPTREQGEVEKEETSFMRIWKRLSNTEMSPDIITRCNKLTEKGNLEYGAGRYDEAVKLYREAAKYGFPAAVANLGRCYHDGDGVNKNTVLAMRYFEMASDKGNSLAMHYLGEYYFDGKLVEKNDSLAYGYYSKAAADGYAQSQRMMGRFHEEGIFVAPDRDEALKWYTLAAKQNDADALYKVGMHQVEQDSINGLSKSKLRKSPAIDYMRKAARYGNKEAQAFIVKCFAEGKYLKKSRTKSFQWMKSIADLGDDNALMYVAYCHEKGRGTDVNHQLAYRLYKRLAEKGNEFAIAKVYEFEQLKFFTPSSPKPPGIK